jgi:hypothetical protein
LNYIKQLKKDQKTTYRALAKKLGVSQILLQKLAGNDEMPISDNLKFKISVIFGIKRENIKNE